MLGPDNRSLYTDALSPPAGMVFEKGMAATYSLDLPTLLTVPVQLCLSTSGSQKELLSDGIAMLDSLRRTVSNLCVFCERGRTAVPGQKHFLYSMLEPVIAEALAPSGGAFHPKFWLLKFTDPRDISNSIYRLMVLSRNITADRSWDVALTLEGRKTDEPVDGNIEFRSFISLLPGMAVEPLTGRTATIPEEFSDELEYIEWELPRGFFDLKFHITGMGAKSWLPESSASLVVVSPFLSPEVLRSLAETSREPLALVSRTEEMVHVPEEVLSLFRRRLVLHEAAELEEGEEIDSSETGLHAKLYIFKEWHNTHIVLGSANATAPALLRGSNVELLVELVGKSSAVGRPEDFLSGEKGIGEVVVDYDMDTEPPETDDEEIDIRRMIEELRRELVRAGLQIRCVKSEGNYLMELTSYRLIEFSEELEVRTWPITVDQQKAVLLRGIGPEEVFQLSAVDVASLTGFIAFDLSFGGIKERFVLNLPISGVPEERESAILRTIIENKDGFVRYLRMLLGGLHDMGTGTAAGFGSGKWFRRMTGSYDAILEDLVLALSRDRTRLVTVARLIEDLRQEENCSDIFPDGFLEMWQVFEKVLMEKP